MNLDLVIARAAPPPERISGDAFAPIPMNEESRAKRKSRLTAAFGSVEGLAVHAESVGLSLDDWLRRFDDVRLCGPEPDWAIAFRQIYERLGTGSFPFSKVRRFAKEQIRNACPENFRLAEKALEGPLDYLASRLSMALYPTVGVDSKLNRPLDWARRFETSPVLAYALGRIFVDWVADMRRLLRLAASDQRIIANSILGCDNPGVLLGINCGLGDPHMGGRSVAILQFEHGAVVFKPKYLRVASAVGEIASCIESVALSQPSLVVRDGYAWERVHESRALADVTEAACFYRSLGGWLFLLQALGAMDFWFDNLIAEGAVPRFVDFETGVQPSREWPRGVRPLVGRGEILFKASPGAVGILPLQFPTRPGKDPMDIGCLAVPGTFEMPLPDYGASGLTSLEAVRFAPHYEDGTFADVAHHYDAFEEGYLRVARELERPDAQASILQSLRENSDARIRVIPADTWTFYRIMFRSLYPCFLADATWREIALHDMIPSRPELIGTLRESAVCDLRRLDIPFFQTCLGSLDLFGTHGKKIQRYYSQNSIDAARDRLGILSKVDDDDRIALLRSCFSVRLNNPPRLRPSSGAVAAATSANLLDWANEMADRVVSLAVANDRGAPTWIGLYQDAFGGARFVSPMGFDVLSGRAGLALALFRLGDALGRTDLVTLACESLANAVEECMNGPAFFLASGAGYGVGAAGLVVALAQVSELLPHAREAYEIAHSSEIWLKSGSDVISGLEGWKLATATLGKPAPRTHGPERSYAPSVLPRLACWLDRSGSMIHNIDRTRATAMRRDFERHGTWFAQRWLDDRHNLSGTDGVPALAVRFVQLAAQLSNEHESDSRDALWPPAALQAKRCLHTSDAERG